MQTLTKIIIVIFLCLWIGSASADVVVIIQPVGGEIVCETSQQNEDSADTDNYDVGAKSDEKYFGTKFVYSGTNGKAICKIALWLSKTGSPTRNYYARIYTHDSGNDTPDTVIGTSDAVASSSVGESEEKVYFTLSTPSSALSNGTTYWVGLNTASYDGSNYLNWHITDGATERIFDSADGSSWSYRASSKTCKWEIYSQ